MVPNSQKLRELATAVYEHDQAACMSQDEESSQAMDLADGVIQFVDAAEAKVTTDMVATARNMELYFEDQELAELLRKVAVDAIQGCAIDGAHHKRWILQELIRDIQACHNAIKEPGIIP